MYQFRRWCFLCAGEKNVEVEIQSLDEMLRENIGQFSIINFTLMGVPSSICRQCHTFLKDYEMRKERYSRAEQMFMELLKTKSKTVDVSSIRAKYKINDEEDVSLNDTLLLDDVDHTPQEHSKVSSVESPAPVIINNTARFDGPAPMEAIVTRRTAKKDPPQVAASAPILLNPTIHVKIRNIHRIELFKCDFCSHTNSTKLSMERHMKQIHLKKSAVSFQCETCSKAFAKKALLQNHQKIHMAVRPTYDCQHCGKVLSSKTAVASHIKWLHKEQREFRCSSCSKMFATKESLNEHIKIHSDFKGHVCPICHKNYKTASTLVQHIDTHGETEYHCTKCGMRLNSKRTLRQHMLRHSDVTRHTCKICKAQFKRTKAFKEHLISQHTEIRAYSCDWCSKTFSNGANCRKHKKEAHPTELSRADKSKFKKIVQLPKIEELLSLSIENQLSNKD